MTDSTCRRYPKLNRRYFRLIGMAHIENILSGLDKDSDEINRVDIPESLDIWFYNLLENYHKTKNHKKGVLQKICTLKAAAYFLILALLISCASLSIKPVRARVFNFFIATYEKFTEIISGTRSEDAQENGDGFICPGWLPEGYILKECVDTATVFTCFYVNGMNETLEITQMKDYADLQIDTEGAVLRNIEIAGFEGVISIRDDSTILVFYTDSCSFIISGHISEDDMVRIAEGLIKK